MAYDNFNFKDSVRDQVIGSSRSIMRNLTSAILVKTPHLPQEGLFQHQIHSGSLLDAMDILESPSGGLRYDHIAKAVARHFVAEAVRYMHPSAVNIVFGNDFDSQFEMPSLDVLQPLKTPVYLCNTMFENEATLNGTARIHKELFVDQIGLGRMDETDFNSPTADRRSPSTSACGSSSADSSYLDTAPEFSERLFLAYGDQLTAARIRGVKFGQQKARRAFERRNWLLGPPVWFHTLQAILHMIVRTHWEPPEPGQFSRATLLHDISYLNRYNISKDNPKYFQMQPLVTQGFKARVLALFYRSMQSNGHLESIAFPQANPTERSSSNHQQRFFDMHDAAVRRLSSTEFNTHVDAICQHALSRSAWLGKDIEDLEFVTMCRFMQEALLFMQLQHAVKFGDIGLLRRLVDPLAVVFYGSNQYQYGFEMLHLRWLLLHTDPELQRAILACSLVNERGERDTFKSIDLVLEHINLGFALDIKKLKNSTHDVTSTFSRGSLAHNELRDIRAAFELNFGARTNTAHSYKRAEHDVFNLAVFLNNEGCNKPRVRLDTKEQFLSRDLYGVGTEALETKIPKFNTEIVRGAGSSTDGESDNRDLDIAADPAAAVVHETVLNTLSVADDHCFIDGDIGEALDRHMEELSASHGQ